MKRRNFLKSLVALPVAAKLIKTESTASVSESAGTPSNGSCSTSPSASATVTWEKPKDVLHYTWCPSMYRHIDGKPYHCSCGHHKKEGEQT